MTTNWVPRPANLLTEVKAADAAAQAARAVPGVVRLQPGVLGLLRHFAAQAWTQATGKALPDIAGVDADLTADGLRIDLRIVVSVFYRAADVGEAVHRAVASVVEDAQIHVHIVEVDLEPVR